MINFKINNKNILTQTSSTFIIAEIGINHEGSYANAKKMIAAAFKAGADAVKLQIVNADESYDKSTQSYRMFKKSSLSIEQYEKLFNYFNEKKILFATPGDFESLNMCQRLKVPLYKISSGLMSNLPLALEISKSKKPMIISTGMANIKEINKILKVLKYKNNNNLALLHCTSLYPALLKQANLNSIRYMYLKYKKIIGYSDHTIGWKASILAVASGAKIIEKHFTLDRKRRGFDHKISLDPTGFKKMVDDIREVEKILGGDYKLPLNEEIKNKQYIERYCVAKLNIKKGDIFTIDNVKFIRLNSFKNLIKAYDFKKIAKKKSNKYYSLNEPIIMDNKS